MFAAVWTGLRAVSNTAPSQLYFLLFDYVRLVTLYDQKCLFIRFVLGVSIKVLTRRSVRCSADYFRRNSQAIYN
jgi:hypothetical protein